MENKIISVLYVHLSLFSCLSSFIFVTVLKFLRLSQDPVTLELKRGESIQSYFVCVPKPIKFLFVFLFFRLILDTKQFFLFLVVLSKFSTQKNTLNSFAINLIVSSIVFSTTPKLDPKIKEDVQNYLDQNNHHFSSGGDSSPSPSRSSHSTSSHLSSPQLHHSNNSSRPSRIPTIIRSPVHTSSKHTVIKTETKLSRITQITKVNGSDHSSSSSCGDTGHNKSNSIHNNSSNDGPHEEPSTKKKCGFEAYMMTGDLILNLSRTQQTSGITSNAKKVSFYGISARTQTI